MNGPFICASANLGKFSGLVSSYNFLAFWPGLSEPKNSSTGCCYITFMLLFFCILALSGCKQESYTPNPEGYPRIQLPEKAYQSFDSTCPFQFKYPTYAKIIPDTNTSQYPCWMNIWYKPLGAKLYLSYRSFDNLKQLNKYREDARTFVYKHTVKATDIQENRIVRDSSSGIFYELGGNTATAIQFFVTDSTRHFLRGSLYFDAKPNRDSLRPAIQFLREDILKMVHTLQWKNDYTRE